MASSIQILITNNSASITEPTLKAVEKPKRNLPSQSLTTPLALAFLLSKVKDPSQLILTSFLGGGIQQTNLEKLGLSYTNFVY